jgi:hypothetical protein
MATERIDVHAHYLPEVYRDALVTAGQTQPDGIPALPDWSEAQAIDAMDKLDVRLAILSISSPGVHFGDADAAAALARAVNETGAQITAANPTGSGSSPRSRCPRSTPRSPKPVTRLASWAPRGSAS